MAGWMRQSKESYLLLTSIDECMNQFPGEIDAFSLRSSEVMKTPQCLPQFVAGFFTRMPWLRYQHEQGEMNTEQ